MNELYFMAGLTIILSPVLCWLGRYALNVKNGDRLAWREKMNNIIANPRKYILIIILFGLFITMLILAFSADEADLTNESYNDCCIDYCYNSEYPVQCCEDYCMAQIGEEW